MIDTIYVVTLYEYEEESGEFYFSSKEKAQRYMADMAAGFDGDMYLTEGSIDVPYEMPKTVWFCVDEGFRTTTAYYGDFEQTEHYNADEGLCYVEVAYRRDRRIMEAVAIARAKEMLLERAR